MLVKVNMRSSKSQIITIGGLNGGYLKCVLYWVDYITTVHVIHELLEKMSQKLQKYLNILEKSKLPINPIIIQPRNKYLLRRNSIDVPVSFFDQIALHSMGKV